MMGHVGSATGHYVPRRGTSEAAHLPASPGTRRNLTPAKSEHEHVGNDALVKSNFKVAVAAYTAAIEQDPRNPMLYRNRAAAYAQLSQFLKAQKDTEMVCQLMPNNRKVSVIFSTMSFHRCLERGIQFIMQLEHIVVMVD